MIDPIKFLDTLQYINVSFFSGVPDSLLKDFCACVEDRIEEENHIIAANEGGAISIGIGTYLATKKIPLIYLQNSGLGNIINPLTSLADNLVYGIPMLIMIGWRGEPNTKDEPQHVKQGLITEELIKVLGLPYIVLDAFTIDFKTNLESLKNQVMKNNQPGVILVRANTFSKYNYVKANRSNFELSREASIKIISEEISSNSLIVSTTGKASRELFETRKIQKQNSIDFLTVGGMGHANQIAFGLALKAKSKRIYCIDGDGAALMHLGGLGIIGSIVPDNFCHIILNNSSHDSVGGQPTIGSKISFSEIANKLNYPSVKTVSSKKELVEAIKNFEIKKELTLIEVNINGKSRSDLGRPTKTPIENKKSFMKNFE